MSNEFDDPNLDVNQPAPDTKRAMPAVPSRVFTLVTVLLAVACAYLVWLHGEDRVLIQLLQDQGQQARDQYEELRGPSKEAREALTELADHAASETTLHHSQGNRQQALADLDRAQKRASRRNVGRSKDAPTSAGTAQQIRRATLWT